MSELHPKATFGPRQLVLRNAEMKLIPDFMRDAVKIEQHKKYELALLQFLAGPGTKPIIHGYPIYPR